VKDGPDGLVDYTVHLTDPNGEPVRDADVRLRGTTAEGVVVEAPLDPTSTPGAFHAVVTFSPRGPRNLVVRVARRGDVTEVPVSGPR